MTLSKPLALVTLDVERDWIDGKYSRIPQFNLLRRALPIFVKTAREYGVPLTLFVTGEVAELCGELLTDFLDEVEVGTHTHPCFHPFVFKGRDVNDKRWDLLEVYSKEEQLQMIKRDTTLITKHLGIKPIAFRAGKLSANEDTFCVLRGLGYAIDSSLEKPVTMSSKVSGPRPKLNLLDFAKNMKILELPVSLWISRRRLRSLRDKLSIARKLVDSFLGCTLDGITFVIGFHPTEFAVEEASFVSLQQIFRWLSKLYLPATPSQVAEVVGI